jgi:serine/threonine protein kinase
MTAVADRTEFLRVLELSKLLDPAALGAVFQSADLPVSPGQLAEQLVQQGTLTRFQAKQLLAGRHRGFVLGPYRLLDQIGQGGMGTVFLAEHATLKRRVAVKILAREQAENPAAVERFQREARAASAFCHPNVMRVHHAGQTGGTHYMVMEYIDGATLEDLIDRKGPLGITDAVRVAAQAAAGLQHAHEKGFVHRDIKPENLMLTRAGELKILDMGLTKCVTRAEDNLTGVLNSSVVLGTIDYLSPEQAMQSAVDARADVYSLGATLFTLLTGMSPYEGVPAKQKLMQHQCGAVPDVQTFCPDVPDGLAAVVAKMMAKKPDERYASAVDVIEALAPWLDETDAGPPSGVMRVPRVPSKTPTTRDAAGETQSDLVLPQPRQPWLWVGVGLAATIVIAAVAIWSR